MMSAQNMPRRDVIAIGSNRAHPDLKIGSFFTENSDPRRLGHIKVAFSMEFDLYRYSLILLGLAINLYVTRIIRPGYTTSGYRLYTSNVKSARICDI